MFVGERIEFVGVKGGGIQELRCLECDGVEVGRVEGHQSRVNYSVLCEGGDDTAEEYYDDDGFFHATKIRKGVRRKKKEERILEAPATWWKSER